jgi:hypothetical protein
MQNPQDKLLEKIKVKIKQTDYITCNELIYSLIHNYTKWPPGF